MSSEWSENLTKQDEEVEALSSIYGNDWTIESDVSRTYRIRVEENKQEALLYVTMPPEYPSMSPPKLELSAPWMERNEKAKLQQALNEVYLENVGETVIYQWVEKVREILLTLKPDTIEHIPAEEVNVPLELSLLTRCPDIIHGDSLCDRKSVFQGHLAVVYSIDEVKIVLSKLKESKKIKNATHNMWAYRIMHKTKEGMTVMQQDCFDDGEAQGGAKVLRMLNLLDQRSTLVVVSRWYGGIQLGPDRFRHISQATRLVVQRAGLMPE